jgi:plasmid stability protein
MSITIPPELESRLRVRAEAYGLSVEAYVERLVRADQKVQDELESLALEGLNSGEPIEAGPGYWEEKHRKLDARWNKTNSL